MKRVRAVAPYIHPGFLNFKMAPYEAWQHIGGSTASAHYPWRMFHGLAYRWELPTLWKNKTEARLRFIEPVSVSFDSFPDYARYEIIPFVWDCWPCYFEKMCAWLRMHGVRTAIFTSSQTAEQIKERFPDMNVMFCPEGVDTTKYIAGKELKDRNIDLLEFGRKTSYENKNQNQSQSQDKIRYVCTKIGDKFMFTNEQLVEAMGDAKVTIALPRSITHPEVAGDIETLTQRYWECMLSRMVMVGHAPKELVDLIGYNPVVEINENKDQYEKETLRYDNEQLMRIIKVVLGHIEDYQELVDRNREMALKMGDWKVRMEDVMCFLKRCNYKIE